MLKSECSAWALKTVLHMVPFFFSWLMQNYLHSFILNAHFHSNSYLLFFFLQTSYATFPGCSFLVKWPENLFLYRVCIYIYIYLSLYSLIICKAFALAPQECFNLHNFLILPTVSLDKVLFALFFSSSMWNMKEESNSTKRCLVHYGTWMSQESLKGQISSELLQLATATCE